jgi:hypothetical protein
MAAGRIAWVRHGDGAAAVLLTIDGVIGRRRYWAGLGIITSCAASQLLVVL